MAQRKVSFTVNDSEGIDSFWIAVGENDVNLGTNNKGLIALETGRSHLLIWFMVGNPGASLAIVGEVDTGGGQMETVVEVKKSRIPAGEIEGGNTKRFNLSTG